MTFPLINESVSDRLVGALCNTLMHSLWQGILLAAMAGLIVICTRKASSALRYNLLISTLLLFAVGVSATFVWQFQKNGGAIAAEAHHFMQPFHADNTVVITNPVAPATQAVPAPHVSFTDRVSGFLNDHHNTIVLIWFLIICARSLQLGVGLYGTYRLRNVHVFAVKNHWMERMRQLADALGIKQTITLLESGLAKVPMVIGHLKPVILVPIGLLTALSAEEVEAILVHELAHIKRRDYLVNMLQSLMEIIFFFNPAVLWVSVLIKTERENCCDDLVLAQNNNKVSYIRALLSCEEYQSSVPAYAMGLPGSKNTSLQRVKRMVSNRNYSLNMFEKTVLAICLVILGLGVSAFTAREDIKKAVKSIVAAIHHETAAPKDKIAKSDTTKKQLTALNGLIEKFQENTPKTTGNPELDALVNKIDSLKDKSGDANSYISQFGKPDTGRYTKILKDLLAKKDQPDSNLLKSLLADRSWQNNKMLATLMAKSDSFFKPFNAVARELYREHLLADTSHLNITFNEKDLIVNGVRLPQDVHDRMYSKYGDKFDDSNNADNNASSGRTYTSDAKKQSQGKVDLQGEDEKTRDIINDMLKDGIITGTDDLSFKIGTTEFVVNYKKQPEAIYQKYRARYVPKGKKGDWIWFYQFDTNKWDQIQGRKSSEDFHGTATGVFQGKENVNTGYNRNRYNNGTPKAYATSANNYNRWDAYSDSLRNERNRKQAETDKKLVADLLQDGLITDPNNVTFTLNYTTVTINGKKQSDEVHKKYKEKYMPATAGTGWNWTYSHHE